jgi:hypothetical protein
MKAETVRHYRLPLFHYSRLSLQRSNLATRLQLRFNQSSVVMILLAI